MAKAKEERGTERETSCTGQEYFFLEAQNCTGEHETNRDNEAQHFPSFFVVTKMRKELQGPKQ
eukprot:10999724-Heterocapsa_arctica.AAC.1